MKKFNPNSIRVIRTTMGMTLEAFAKSLGDNVSRQIIYQWETGAQVPSVPYLLKIVNAHKVPFEIFFELDGNHSKTQEA